MHYGYSVTGLALSLELELHCGILERAAVVLSSSRDVIKTCRRVIMI